MTRIFGTFFRAAALAGGCVALSGCVSLGAEPPESLLTLSASNNAEAGAMASAGTENLQGAIAVLPIEAPAKLDVTRIPVAVSDTEIAYLQDAFWVEKPARLFRRLLGERLRASGQRLVVDTDDAPLLAAQTLRGTLLDMGYDATSSSVIVRYDAVRTAEDGTVTSRRFEARESGVLAEPSSVGPALNRAANTVAGDVAQWMTGG